MSLLLTKEIDDDIPNFLILPELYFEQCVTDELELAF